jgi:ATP-binding cassette subfamily B protein
MRYIKEILKNNRIWVLAYIGLGIFNAFMANYKTDYFQKVIDGLATGTLTFAGVITYGLILLVNYCMNYLDNYPEKKLEYGIYLDFKLLSLRKISTIDYTEYQKIGTGKLVQRIENGSSAGRNVVFNFWLRLIRDLLPTIVFSVYFIWKIDKIITYILFVGYMLIFIITNILLKFLYKIKEKILNSEELFNHFLVRGFMEMLVFRMSKQFPSEIKKTRSAKENIVSSKVKMNMIHEAFFYNICATCGNVRYWYFILRMENKKSYSGFYSCTHCAD